MNTFIALDLETTGVNPYSDKIIEYAFIKFNAVTFEEIESLSGFVNPQIEIPQIIQQLTGIQESDVRNAVLFSDMIGEIEDFIGGSPLVGHNLIFDINFLKSAGVNVQYNPLIDTFLLANYLSVGLPSLSLSSLCKSYDIALDAAHRALDDTRASLQLLKKYSHLLATLAEQHGEILSYIYARSKEVGDRILFDLYIKPFICTHISKFEELYNIHKNHFQDTIKVKDILDRSTELHSRTYDYIKKFPDFEYRESQERMSDIIDTLFRSDAKVAIEAPTGTGKTFSYLVSAIYHALQEGSQICIATSTKVLQKQIYEKDLVFLKDQLPFSFSYVKLMGRKNYFSLAGYYHYFSLYESFSQSEGSFFLKLYFWSIRSSLGELQELDLYPDEYYHIPYIHGNTLESSVQGEDMRGEFYLAARKHAEIADIIISNSSVVIQDIETSNTIFGDIDTMIFDEAHTLEDVVTQACMKKYSLSHIERIFSTLQRKLQKQNISLSLPYDDILYKFSEISHECAKIAGKELYYNANYKKYLFKKHEICDSIFLKRTAEALLFLIKGCEEQLSQLENKQYFNYEIQECIGLQKFIREVFISPDFDSYVYICDISNHDSIEISYSILHTGEYLFDALWSQKKRILLTSATLFEPSSESYTHTLLGTAQFETHILPQVFDYKNQAQVYLPHDSGGSRSQSQIDIDFLHELFKAIGGKGLMLCTSYKVLKEIYESLVSQLQSSDINLIVQGFSGGRNKHIESFKQKYQHSILVGTDSFWQGIDFPGEMLEYLIVQKIPFSPPSDPIFKARTSLFQNGFYDYAIPKASVKLRQGFGRLIRTKKDHGAIILLDTRIMTEKWGKVFLSGFPQDIGVYSLSRRELLERIET